MINTQRLRRFEQGTSSGAALRCRKGDGAGKGRDARRTAHWTTGSAPSGRPQGDAHILGVDLAQLVRPDGLGKQEGQQRRDAADNGHIFTLSQLMPEKGAEDQLLPRFTMLESSAKVTKIRQCRADIADRHAADHQQAHALDPLGEIGNEAHGYHSSHEGRRDENGGGGGLCHGSSSASMATHTVIFAPEEIPSTKGPAMGLWKKVCSIAGQGQRPPRIGADRSRGSRMLYDDTALCKAPSPPSRIAIYQTGRGSFPRICSRV